MTSGWIKVSSWEVSDSETWTRTCVVLRHHQVSLASPNSPLTKTLMIPCMVIFVCLTKENLNEYINGFCVQKPEWIPDNLTVEDTKVPVQIKMLCGADVLETFNRPGLWKDEHVSSIRHTLSISVVNQSFTTPTLLQGVESESEWSRQATPRYLKSRSRSRWMTPHFLAEWSRNRVEESTPGVEKFDFFSE